MVGCCFFSLLLILSVNISNVKDNPTSVEEELFLLFYLQLYYLLEN